MKLKLNSTLGIDLPKLIESRLLVQANSGGGKSWAIRRIIEQAFGHVQIIVLDPEGEFTNLREKFPFVYAGKGGDAPVESRSASLLATRLLELKASTIIDLYELPPQERKHFVRLFCEAMVNAPKELWHDTLIIIDEAHVFAPEKGESEAMGPVIDLATRGRKRGYCVVLATQRLPKLNKDAAAECNNKLIGRASQDIDRKRASEELGFTTKEQILSLRDLEPGEFYAFGPAISRDVVRTVIGDVQVKPPKRGVARGHVPAPSKEVKAILSKLADLPKEAQEEAKTIAELKQALANAKREMQISINPEKINEIRANTDAQWAQTMKKFKDTLYQKLLKSHGNVFRALDALSKDIDSLKQGKTFKNTIPGNPVFSKESLEYAEKEMKKPFFVEKTNYGIDFSKNEPIRVGMGSGERQVLIAIAQQPDGMTREHITVQTSFKRSTRDAYIHRLIQKGYAGIAGNSVRVTQEGIDILGNDYQPLPTGEELIQYHLKKLPDGESRILAHLVTDGPKSRDELGETLNYKRSTSDAYIQRLATRQLIVISGQIISANSKLFE